MGGVCCAVSDVCRSTMDPERHPYSALTRNCSIRDASNHLIQDFINRTIKGHSLVDSVRALLHDYEKPPRKCCDSPRFLVNCMQCDVCFCPVCYGKSSHTAHQIQLLLNDQGKQCLCGSELRFDCCTDHIHLETNLLAGVNLEILLAAFQQCGNIIKHMEQNNDLDLSNLAESEIALRVLACAAGFSLATLDIDLITEEYPWKTAARADIPLFLMEHIRDNKLCFLLKDEVFESLYARSIVERNESAFADCNLHCVREPEICLSSGLLEKVLIDAESDLQHEEFTGLLEEMHFFDILHSEQIRNAAAEHEVEFLERVSAISCTLEKVFVGRIAGFRGSSDEFTQKLQPYMRLLKGLVFPLLEASFELKMDTEELLQKAVMVSPAHFCFMPDLVFHLLLAQDTSLITCAVLQSAANEAEMPLNTFCRHLLIVPIRLLSKVEMLCANDADFNQKTVLDELFHDSEYSELYFSLCHFCFVILRLGNDPLGDLTKVLSQTEKDEDIALLRILIISLLESFSGISKEDLGVMMLINRFFLERYAPMNGLGYSFHSTRAFSEIKRRDFLLSARLEVADIDMFMPHLFPNLPDYYFTNSTLYPRNEELFTALLNNISFSSELHKSEIMTEAERIYVGEPLTVSEKLRLLVLMIRGKHVAKIHLRYPEKRLRILESKVFRISHTTDFSRQFAQLLTSKITVDKLFEEESTFYEESEESDEEESDDVKYCALCGQSTLDPVEFAHIRQTFNNYSLITSCAHTAHFECYRRERPTCCPICGLKISYLVAEVREMKAIDKLFSMPDGQLLRVILDTIDYCAYVAQLSDLSDEEKQRIIQPAKKCVETLSGFMYIGENEEKRIARLLSLRNSVPLLSSDAFPNNATRMLLSSPTAICRKCGATTPDYEVCAHCTERLCSHCACPCKGYLRWVVEENRVMSWNGKIVLPAPYRNLIGQVPSSVFGCGELVRDDDMLIELRRRLLK